MVYSRAAVLAAFASVVVIAGILFPYAVLTSSEVSVYYGVGPISPLLLSVLAAVVAVGAIGVATGRADPATTTGAVLVIGVFLTGLLLWWALETSGVVGGLAVSAMFEYHRWIVVFLAAIIPVAAGWDAREFLGPQSP